MQQAIKTIKTLGGQFHEAQESLALSFNESGHAAEKGAQACLKFQTALTTFTQLSNTAGPILDDSGAKLLKDLVTNMHHSIQWPKNELSMPLQVLPSIPACCTLSHAYTAALQCLQTPLVPVTMSLAWYCCPSLTLFASVQARRVTEHDSLEETD